MVTVCSGVQRRTFPGGRDIVVGRDVRADLRIPHPAISRAHLILRCVDDHWTAVDNDSRTGVFVGAERVDSVAVVDRTAIRLGSPDGPRLSFELRQAPDTERSAELTIGRDADNDIVVSDMLASRHHATLAATPSGMQIRDLHSALGTFVNGQPVKRRTLCENDIVTVGNVDFAFTADGLVRRTETLATTGGLEIADPGLTVIDGDVMLLDRVSLTAAPGTLTAVIGPSGSGKSTLLKVLAGLRRPTRGAVRFDGRDLHLEYESLRGRLGIVPQADIVHRRLSAAEALTTAAKLLLAADTTRQELRQVISRVLEELGITELAHPRICTLSDAQRKRVSIATELLTEPSLLLLDEPTTGLDPALDRELMAMLHTLADAGRVIVIATNSLRFIDDCDQVLLLAPGGKTAYRGAPGPVAEVMGSADWADIYSDISANPVQAQERYFRRHGSAINPAASPGPRSAVVAKPTRTRFWRQVLAISQRQSQLVVADRRYLALLVLAPVVAGLLTLAAGGSASLTTSGSAPFGPRQTIVLLIFAAFLLGSTLTARDLIGERVIYRHEQASGLSPSAYLLAKILVFAAVAAAQSALLLLTVTAPGIGKHAPRTAAALSSPMLELFVDVSATAISAAVLGLAISSVSASDDSNIPLLAVVGVAQLAFVGSFVPVTGRPVLETIAAFTPARWGFAATASTVDLTNLIDAEADPLWEHATSAWCFDMGMLAVLTLVFAGFLRWRLRRGTEA
jgi:ABC transport system ATP-binding/permease protein